MDLCSSLSHLSSCLPVAENFAFRTSGCVCTQLRQPYVAFFRPLSVCPSFHQQNGIRILIHVACDIYYFPFLIETADGLVVGSPVYYAGPNGSLCALLDRLFYSSSGFLKYKPAAAVAVCRRGGASATFDRLNKYFTITDMPVVPSQYWNSVHGRLPGEAAQDAEGLQTMRTLGRNMAWMLKSRAAGNLPEPEPEAPVRTNFIR